MPMPAGAAKRPVPAVDDGGRDPSRERGRAEGGTEKTASVSSGKGQQASGRLTPQQQQLAVMPSPMQKRSLESLAAALQQRARGLQVRLPAAPAAAAPEASDDDDEQVISSDGSSYSGSYSNRSISRSRTPPPVPDAPEDLEIDDTPPRRRLRIRGRGHRDYGRSRDDECQETRRESWLGRERTNRQDRFRWEDEDRDARDFGRGWRSFGGGCDEKFELMRDWGFGGRSGGRSRGKGGQKGNQREAVSAQSSGISRVHVANLPGNATEDALWSTFSPFGKILGVKLLPSRGSSVSTAIVRFSSPVAAEAAIAALHRKPSRVGYTLEVKLARPNPKWEG